MTGTRPRAGGTGKVGSWPERGSAPGLGAGVSGAAGPRSFPQTCPPESAPGGWAAGPRGRPFVCRPRRGSPSDRAAALEEAPPAEAGMEGGRRGQPGPRELLPGVLGLPEGPARRAPRNCGQVLTSDRAARPRAGGAGGAGGRRGRRGRGRGPSAFSPGARAGRSCPAPEPRSGNTRLMNVSGAASRGRRLRIKFHGRGAEPCPALPRQVAAPCRQGLRTVPSLSPHHRGEWGARPGALGTRPGAGPGQASGFALHARSARGRPPGHRP